MDYFNTGLVRSMAIAKTGGLLLHHFAIVYNGILLNFFTVTTNTVVA